MDEPDEPVDDDDEAACDDGWCDSVSGTFLFTIVTTPWWVPPRMLDDNWSTLAHFPKYPYAGGHRGYLYSELDRDDRGDPWNVRLSTEYGTDFDDVGRLGVRLTADTLFRVGIDTEWNRWIDHGPDPDDPFSTGDFNLVCRFAQSETVQFHSGLGVNWLTDDAGSDFGPNLTYGIEYYPRDPLVFSASMDVGTIGHAGYAHFRTTAGITRKHGEAFVGYDLRRFNDIRVHGLIAGARFTY